MSALLALSEIPPAARAAERAARDAAPAAADKPTVGFEIVPRPGWHGRPSDDPPVEGRVLSLAAAQALAWEWHHQLGLGRCRRLAYRPADMYGQGTWPERAVGRE